MEQELERAAVAAVKSVGDRGPTTPIPPNVRHAVLAYASAARRSGRSWRDIAGVVGVSAAALHNWRRETPVVRERRRRPRSLLAPIVITERHDSESQIVLVTAAGRVEGLDIAGLAELLRRLA